MATIYKRRDLRPIPEGAEIVTYRGKRYAKWTNAKTGNAQRAPLNPAGDKIICESPNYTIQYFDHDGRRQKVSAQCADRDAAQQLANNLEAEAMCRRKGLIDPTVERLANEGRRAVSEHVADFRGFLEAKGSTAAHVEQTCRRVNQLIADCHVKQLSDLSGSAVLVAIGTLRDDGTSLRTCNAYLRSIKSFTRWLRREKRTADDALAGLSQFNEATDRRHVRRELTTDELTYLLDYIERQGRENYKLSGAVRAMAYRVALGTGFRVKELRTLTPASFDLDADPATVTVAAAYSKRRRQDVQPIRPDLAESLGLWLRGKARDEQLFRLPHNTSKMFQRDLAAARAAWIAQSATDGQREQRDESDFLQYRDADGRVADFHGLRHTYISGIVATGASVKTAQELARHSTPVLTIGRYSHARLHDLTGALDALPDLQPTKDGPETYRATGTDDQAAVCGGSSGGSKAAKRDTDGASHGESHPSRNDDADCRNVLMMNTFGDNRQDVAEVVRGGIEPPTHGFSVHQQTAKSPGKTLVSKAAGAVAGAVETKTCNSDADLQAIVDRWPDLPKAIRDGIVAIVRSAGGVTGQDR